MSLASGLFKLAANVPAPCAVADYGRLICLAKIMKNAKRNDEFKYLCGNSARRVLAVRSFPEDFLLSMQNYYDVKKVNQQEGFKTLSTTEKLSRENIGVNF